MQVDRIAILLIEDNPGDARLLQELLAETGSTAYQVEWVDRLATGQERLQAERFDVVLLDLFLPDSQGLDTFARFQASAEKTPVIVLSGHADEVHALQMVHAGAQDYLVKGEVDGRLIARAIRYAIERKAAELERRSLLEQAQAARAVAENAYAQLTQTLERIDDAFIAFDSDWKYVYVNARAEQLLRNRRDDLLGRPIGAVLPSLAASPIYRALRSALAEQRPVSIEAYFAALGVWLDVRGYPSEDGISLYLQDVSDRHAAERERERLLWREQAARAAAETERARFQTILAAAPGGVLYVDQATGEIVGNDGAVQLFGRSLCPEAGSRQNLGFLFWRDGRALIWEELPSSRALQGQTIAGEEIIVRRPDGTAVPVVISASPVYGPAGDIQGAVATFQDISAIKEVERLRQEWTSVITHDLRQPVSVIKGFTGLLAATLRDRDQAAPESRAVHHISLSADLLNRMIGDLLDASQLETNRLRLDRRPLDLPGHVREVTERLSNLTTGHSVVIQSAPALPPVLADPARVEQVLGNLLSNAVRYGFPATEITVAVTPADEDAIVTVTNRGPGLQPEDFAKLFTRFHRSRAARDAGARGIGLGLYITRGLVEAHGGRVWAESVPGETTAFSFSLPYASPTGADASLAISLIEA